MTDERWAWGWGLANVDAAGNTLDVWYPNLEMGDAKPAAPTSAHGFGALVGAAGFALSLIHI